ncbi:hypothetical protein V6D40_05210, partial [Corynebacterium sp. Q4381]|uniref:hypothetical protein n=1 Tax=Corynebacterium sp. Marseille-Q4381 TaxID=3121597 RepID=UPI002FE586DA
PQPQPEPTPPPPAPGSAVGERQPQGFGGGSAPGGSSRSGGSPAAPQAEFKTTSAPHALLLPSLILALIALILDAVVGFGPLRSIDTQWGVLTGIAWALSGIVGVSALGLYFTKNTEARANGLYEIVGWKQTLFYATVAALVVAVVVSSVMFALWFGRQ